MTSAELRALVKVKTIRILELENAGITDDGLKIISTMTQLVILNLRGNKITDNGIQHLLKLKRLVELNLSKNEIGSGVKALKSLSLAGLNVSETLIEEKDVRLVQKLARFVELPEQYRR